MELVQHSLLVDTLAGLVQDMVQDISSPQAKTEESQGTKPWNIPSGAHVTSCNQGRTAAGLGTSCAWLLN